MAIKHITSDPVLVYGKPAYNKPGLPFLLANTDITNPVFYGQDLTITPRSSQIPALGSVGFDGTRDVYASTLSSSIAVDLDYIPGGTQWAPSPAQVALQISTLGLAKESGGNLQGVNANTLNALSAGIPPGVPNIASASAIRQGPGTPVTLATMPANGRIWAVSLSYAVAADTSFTPPGNFYCDVITDTGLILESIELALNATSENDSDHGDLQLGGLPLANGKKIQLDVNGNIAVAHVLQRASVNVLYSVP